MIFGIATIQFDSLDEEKEKEKEKVKEERSQRMEEPKIEVPPAVQYDPAIVASTKKRVIIKK